jgi:hypothetical protein
VVALNSIILRRLSVSAFFLRSSLLPCVPMFLRGMLHVNERDLVSSFGLILKLARRYSPICTCVHVRSGESDE